MSPLECRLLAALSTVLAASAPFIFSLRRFFSFSLLILVYVSTRHHRGHMQVANVATNSDKNMWVLLQVFFVAVSFIA